MNFFEEAGVPLKVERGNRVFPQSDHSSDIIRALERELKKAGAKVHLHTTVKEIVKKPEAEKVTGVILEDDTFMEGDAVIVPPAASPTRVQAPPGTDTVLQENWA